MKTGIKLVTSLIIIYILGCEKEVHQQSPQQLQQTPQQAHQSVQQETGGTSVAGISWTIPGGWKEEGERPMRFATYSVPPTKGDKECGEVAVFFFGGEQGGDVKSNIERWIEQFEPKSTHSTSQRNINGLDVALVNITGTYLAPGPMMESTGKKMNYKLVGAIINAPGGMVFFKFVGPIKTVQVNETKFEELLTSLKKG